MVKRTSTLVTMLFTDVVNSTDLLSRAGDEDAQRIFRAHHTLLAETAAAHGGAEVKWLGDGLMASFSSAADALRCAIAMQQASLRPVAGERLAIRVGLNAGEAFRDEADFFGTSVVVARRLCDRADAGQILCSELVAGLLAGRAGFSFVSLGDLELKGVPQPVGALEVQYEAGAAPGLVAHLPFVGRQEELARLVGMLGETRAGHGGLVFLVGEAGIGKTRLTEELTEAAGADGFSVLWGHCLDGDWAPPYAPFVEAVEALGDGLTPGELRADLGSGGAALSQLVPALRERVPDLPEVAPVQPDEERFRLLDAMAQFLAARARRAPVLLCLDDLHWADGSTVAMLRHVVRCSPGHRLLVMGTYRDAEVSAGHPLHDAIASLRREVEFERLKLEGLESKAVAELLEALADHDVVGSVAAAIAAETDGNPFFIKEVLRHLLDEGRFYRSADGRWTSDRPVAELGIPEGVREVIDRRLGRLSADANKFMSAASVFEGDVHLDIAARVAGLDEDAALDALDEALDAQLLQPAGGIDTYRFTHALIRHTLADELSPSRRARIHLRAADALGQAAGKQLTPAQAGEIASQYHRAAGLPGAERGVDAALAAATHAEGVAGHREAAEFLRIALDLAPEGDSCRPRLLARLGIALAWSLAFDEVVAVAGEAGDLLAASEGAQAAAQYLSDAAYTCAQATAQVQAWALAGRGLAYAGERRDVPWARMISLDHERRAAEDPEQPGIPVNSAERTEAARILRNAHLDPLGPAPMEAVFDSRDEALASSNLVVHFGWVGEFSATLPRLQLELEQAQARGQLARAARAATFIAACHLALGRLDEGRRTLDQAIAFASRIGQPFAVVFQAQEVLVEVTDEGLEDMAAVLGPLAGVNAPALAWARGYFIADLARLAARTGRDDEALQYLDQLVPWLERAPAWSGGFTSVVNHAAEVLWVLNRSNHLDVVEHAIEEKLLKPDFRYPMLDGRLAMGRVRALQRRQDEAAEWLTKARTVLAEQGSRPLLAIVDYDEALMYARRGDPGDTERARPLLNAARVQFDTIGMTGWARRAKELSERLS